MFMPNIKFNVLGSFKALKITEDCVKFSIFSIFNEITAQEHFIRESFEICITTVVQDSKIPKDLKFERKNHFKICLTKMKFKLEHFLILFLDILRIFSFAQVSSYF